MKSEHTRPNPFDVLGVPTNASQLEIRRAADRLLASLSLGLEEDRFFETDEGRYERTEQCVREAHAALSQPETRFMHEVSAGSMHAAPDSATSAPAPPRLPSVGRLMGWRETSA